MTHMGLITMEGMDTIHILLTQGLVHLQQVHIMDQDPRLVIMFLTLLQDL